MQRAAVELALAVASRLLYTRIETGDYPIEVMVQQVVERLSAREEVTVALHPADLALLEARLEEEPDLLGEDGRIRLVADTTIPRGDCRAEVGDVSVLSQLDQQLEELRHHLLESLPDAEVERRQADRRVRRFPDRRRQATA
jgi:flagellar assembly protein FliH